MEKVITRKDSLSHAATILILIYTIFRTYDLAGFRISEILDYILIGIYLVSGGVKRGSLPLPIRKYYAFWVCTILVSVLWTGISGLRPLIGVLHSFLLFSLFFDKVEIPLLIKYYRYFAFACILFFLLQEFTYITTGVRIPGLIPGLHVMSEFGDNASFADSLETGARSSSFFSEPAHFVQFLLPLLCIELFYSCDNKHLFRSAAIGIVLLLAQSGNAMFGLVAVTFIYVIQNMRGKSLKKNILLTSLTLIIGIFTVTYFMRTEKGAAMLDRQDQLSMNDYESGRSGFFRIYRGYFVYDNLEPIEKVIGVNDFGTMRQRIKTSSVGFMFDETDTYFNLIQDVLIRTGIIGLLFFTYLLFSMYKNAPYVSKASVACLTALSFISSLYFTPTMALFLIIAYKAKKELQLNS